MSIELALLKAYEEFPVITKDSRNEFEKFNYASLQNIEETIKPILARNGLRLSYSSKTCGDDHSCISVRAVISHADEKSTGQLVSEELILKVKSRKGDNTTPQDFMAYITYAKRYQLINLLGLTTDDEDIDQEDPKTFKEQKSAVQVLKQQGQKEQSKELALSSLKVEIARICENGKTPEDVEEILGLSLDSIKDQATDAIIAMRDYLKKEVK